MSTTGQCCEYAPPMTKDTRTLREIRTRGGGGPTPCLLCGGTISVGDLVEHVCGSRRTAHAACAQATRALAKLGGR